MDIQYFAPTGAKLIPHTNCQPGPTRPTAGANLAPTLGLAKHHLQRLIGYHSVTSIATGTVRDGKVILEGVALPEGALVTVLADDDRPPIKLPPDLEAELQAAIDEADAEAGGAGPEFLESLKRFG